jgi:hypothetical protein
MRMLLLLLLLGFARTPTWACECQESRDSWTYARVQAKLQSNAHVFTGQVVSLTDSTFQVQVLEEFKGKVPRPLLQGRYDRDSSCGIRVREGLWIFYTTLTAAGNIAELDACTFSGNLTEPGLLVVPLPPTWPGDSLARDHYYQVQQTQQRALFLQHWLTEYSLLVAYQRLHPATPLPIPVSTWIASLALGVALLALSVALLTSNKR